MGTRETRDIGHTGVKCSDPVSSTRLCKSNNGVCVGVFCESQGSTVSNVTVPWAPSPSKIQTSFQAPSAAKNADTI